MGDIVELCCAFIPGHAVETHLASSGAPTVGRSRLGAPSNPANPLPPFWRQPQDRLQMAGALSAARRTRAARSFASPASFATAAAVSLDQGHQPLAATTLPLGCQKDSPPSPSGVPAPPGAVRSIHSALVAPFGLGAPAGRGVRVRVRSCPLRDSPRPRAPTRSGRWISRAGSARPTVSGRSP